MKLLVAGVACCASALLAAAYLALAPVGGALAGLDVIAGRFVGTLTREGAVVAVLLLGLVPTLGLFLLARSRAAHDMEFEWDDPVPTAADEPAAGPIWTPEPAPQPEEPLSARTTPHVADVPLSIRREERPSQPEARFETVLRASIESAAPGRPLVSPPPVILIRKPRERDRDWFADASWFGGLPRLNGTPWPCDENGTPLPFVAQIDLAELARACPETPLPTTGSLAFFLGSGAVVAVPEGEHDFSNPPQGLPPAFDEGGTPFPQALSRLSRFFFPFWPVSPVALDLPENLRDHGDPLRETVIEEAMERRLKRHAAMRDHPFYAAGVGAPVEALWWHSVIYLADQVHEANEASAETFAHKLTMADAADPDVDHPMSQHDELAAMAEALDGFITGRDPWTALTDQELDVVGDLLAELHERFGDLVQHRLPGSLAQLATLSLRAMVSGSPEALAAMPDDVLARINNDYRLPPVDQHQMFGLPASRAPSRYDRSDDLLLLQLGYDDMMEWCWGEAGLFQFWIRPQDAAAGNWAAARLTFDES